MQVHFRRSGSRGVVLGVNLVNSCLRCVYFCRETDLLRTALLSVDSLFVDAQLTSRSTSKAWQCVRVLTSSILILFCGIFYGSVERPPSQFYLGSVGERKKESTVVVISRVWGWCASKVCFRGANPRKCLLLSSFHSWPNSKATEAPGLVQSQKTRFNYSESGSFLFTPLLRMNSNYSLCL